MQSQSISFKLSIHKLSLVNSNYPFDFFLRIKDLESEEIQDSPIIEAHSFECDQDFPWEFAVSSLDISIEFIEISSKTQTEIIRSQCTLENTNASKNEIKMIASRSGKPICVIEYSFSNYQNSVANQHLQYEAARFNRNDRERNFNRFSKQEHNELSHQIAEINKSISKILDQEKSEHAIFSRYLEESTSFIKDMINNSKNDRENSYIPEEEEEASPSHSKILNFSREEEPPSNLQSKWYLSKYGRQQPLPLASNTKNYRNQPMNPKFEATLEYSKDYSMLEKKSVLSDLSFFTEIKPKQVVVSQPKSQTFIAKLSCQSGYSYQWNKPVEIPFSQSLTVAVLDIDGKTLLNGCMDLTNSDNSRMKLYDSKGTEKGVMIFRLKKIAEVSVQTHEFLIVDEEAEVNENKQYQSIDSSSPIIKIQLAASNKAESSEFLKVDSNDNTFQEQQQQSLSVIGMNNEQRQEEADQQSSGEQNYFQADEKKKTTQNAQPVRKNPEHSDHQAQEQKTSKVFKLGLPRYKSKSRNKKAADPACDETNKYEPEEFNGNSVRPIRQFNLVSNSISVSFLPFIKQPLSVSQKAKRSPFLSEAEQSLGETTSQIKAKATNVKISFIHIDLAEDSSQYTGKFLKIYTNQVRQPFVTETISLSRNLKWKGKDYFFQSVRPFSELTIEVHNDLCNQSRIIGAMRVCFALLALDNTNTDLIYTDYLRDEDLNQIGNISIGYQCTSSHSRSLSKKRQMGEGEKFPPIDYHSSPNVKKKKRKPLTQKNKGEVASDVTNRKKTTNIGIYSTQAKSIVGTTSQIRNKKYYGGNIVIGRAARFRNNEVQIKPGPGEYEMPSFFERHVSPS